MKKNHLNFMCELLWAARGLDDWTPNAGTARKVTNTVMAQNFDELTAVMQEVGEDPNRRVLIPLEGSGLTPPPMKMTMGRFLTTLHELTTLMLREYASDWK